MFCPDCGSEVAEGRKFCGKCGGQIHAAAEGIEATQSAAPQVTAAPTPRQPISPRQKLVYALVALLVVLGGVGWWWFHRPAPAYKVQDPGIYPFQDQGKWGFIDAQGNVLIQPKLEELVPSLIQGQWAFFNEGLCGIKVNGKWGYIDKRGSLIIPAQFDQARPFVGGIAAVALGSQWGFIDQSGHYVVNPQFENASDFHDGLAPAQKEGKWGFINKSGRFVIPAKFGQANPNGFVDGLAGVQIDGKVGYIDRKGKLVITTNFQEIDDFSEGLARVRLGNRWGYVDTGGKIIINPQFDRALGFSEGRAIVSVAGHWGTIDRTGKFILNPGQYDIPGFAGNLLAVSTNDGLGFMNRDGKWILQPSKAINGFWWPVIGNILYASPTTQGVTPISTSGKILAGWYKGEMLDKLAQDIENEKSALQSVRSLIGAETSYSSTYPAKGFAASLDKLGPATGTPDENHAGLIETALATGTQNGYQFTITIPAGTSTGGANFNYFLVAKPAVGHVGRSFCADSSGSIHYSVQGEECTVTSPIAENQIQGNSADSASTLSLGGMAWRFYSVIGGQWQARDPQSNLFRRTADGLKLNGIGYRGSVGILAVQPIQLDGKAIFIKWKADGAGGYMGVEPSVVFFDTPPPNPTSLPGIPLSDHGFTTANTWEGSTLIRDNVWYYTTVIVQPESLSCVTAEGNYSGWQGGQVIHSTVKPRTSKLTMGGLWLSIVDFYKAEAVSMTVGDVQVKDVQVR